MAFVQHQDFPRSVAGIPGLTPWNFLLLNVAGAWLAKRRIVDGLVWDLPRGTQRLVLAVLAIGFLSTTRLLLDVDGYNSLLVLDEDGRIPIGSFSDFLNEYVLNGFKYVLLVAIIYDGCRSRRQVMIALGCILAYFFCTAVQVIKFMPLSAVTMSAAELSHLSYKLIQKGTGFSRVTVSMLLSGGSWAMVALTPLAQKRSHAFAILGAAAIIAFGQALTGGRAGYATWVLLGIAMGVLKWRKFLVLVPIAVIGVVTFMPAVRDRMMMGFTSNSEGRRQVDEEAVTSGRTTIWPVVIEKIKEQPITGFGRAGMVRSGAHKYISEHIFGESDFGHPHNAYLEQMLDCGIPAACVVFAFYFLLLVRSARLFTHKTDSLVAAAGGVAFALLAALLLACMGAQTLYVSNQSVALWAALAVMTRVHRELSIVGHEELLFSDADVSLDWEDDDALSRATA